MNSHAASSFSREELTRRRAELLDVPMRRWGVWAVVFVVGVAATLWLARYIQRLEDVSSVRSLAACVGITMSALAALLAVFAVRNQNRRILRCPTCGKPVLFDITLATHRCGHCGEQIVNGAVPAAALPLDAAKLPLRAEFAQRVQLARREINRIGLLGLGSLVVGFLLVFSLEGWQESHEASNSSAFMVFDAAPLILALAFPAGLLFWGIRRAGRRHGLACPSCKASLLTERRPNIAVTTGRCPSCGAAVLRDDAPLAACAPGGSLSPVPA